MYIKQLRYAEAVSVLKLNQFGFLQMTTIQKSKVKIQHQQYNISVNLQAMLSNLPSIPYPSPSSCLQTLL